MPQWTWECVYLFKLVFLFSLDIYSGMGMLNHIVVPFLVFWGTSILFFVVTTPVYILTSRGNKRVPFSPHPHLHLEFVGVFGNSHSSDDLQCSACFHVPVGHLYVFFGKMSIQVFCSVFNWMVLFFVVLSCMSFLTLYWSYHLQRISPIL